MSLVDVYRSFDAVSARPSPEDVRMLAQKMEENHSADLMQYDYSMKAT